MSELSDEQKSVMLAKAMGWREAPTGRGFRPEIEDADGRQVYPLNEAWDSIWPDLYLPEHMSLAWRVLNWATSNDSQIYFRLVDWLYDSAESIPDGYKTGGANWFRLFMRQPDEAQRAWLDKILELAIEAGLVGTERVKVE